MKWYLKSLHILSWIPLALIKLVLALIGPLPVFLALVLIGDEMNKTARWPDIFWLWGNKEEAPPRWFLNKAAFWEFDRHEPKQWLLLIRRWFPNWWWYAVRNPVNNLRFIFKDRAANVEGNWTIEPMEAKQMLYWNQQMAYRWSWNGPFAGYRRVWLNDFISGTIGKSAKASSYNEIWFGWKVGSGVPGMGFTMQRRMKREIGK